MASLGLVNYSDDEDSSGDDQTVALPTLKSESKKRPDKPSQTAMATIVKKPFIEAKITSPASTAPIIQKPAILNRPTSTVNEHHLRLMAALAAKPIEGVENWGIPNEPSESCDPERLERIAHFLSLRASGHKLNDHLQYNKAFHNPRIYARLVEFTDVDEFGSNFDKQVFDPYGFPKELYIDGILETQKRQAEEKAVAQQNRSTVDFVSSSASQRPALTQQQNSAMAQAMATAAKVASRIAKPPSPTVGGEKEGAPDSRTNKRKNKWDDEH